MGGCVSAPRNIDELKQYISAGHDVNRPWQCFQMAPLIFMIRSIEGLHLLLEAKANPNIRWYDERGSTTLLHAYITRGETAPLIEALLKAGANPNSMTCHGNRSYVPLGRAVRYDHKAAFRLLLQYGAHPNIQMYITITNSFDECNGDGILETIYTNEYCELLSILFKHSQERVYIYPNIRKTLFSKTADMLTQTDIIVLQEIVRQIVEYGVE